MAQARITGAEIVKRDAHAHPAELVEHALGLVQFLHDCRLGDFDHETMGRERGLGQEVENPVRQRWIGDLPWREIDREVEMLRPGLGIALRLRQQRIGHLANRGGILGDGDERLGQQQPSRRMLPSR